MESESKRRSGSFGSRKASTKADDEVRRLSLSEGSIVEANVSPGSSDTGTLKKSRKFKPRKFIAKRFKSKKSDKSADEQSNTAESGQSEQETSKKSVVAKLSEKLSSPKLKRFNFVRRFSSKKSHKVGPMSGSLDDGIDSAQSNLGKLEGLSVSESSVLEEIKKFTATLDDNSSNASTEIVSIDEPEKEAEEVKLEAPKVPSTSATSPNETVTLESKKVQMKITISGRKVERREVPSTGAIEKASPLIPALVEPSRHRADIILPSTSTQVRLSTNRDQFFNVKVPSDGANVEQRIKPINDESESNPVTFAAVVREGPAVQSAPSTSSSEIEKYLILTSSLNTIISAAKELEDLGNPKGLGFPVLPELRIREATSDSEAGEEVKANDGALVTEVGEKEAEKIDIKSGGGRAEVIAFEEKISRFEPSERSSVILASRKLEINVSAPKAAIIKELPTIKQTTEASSSSQPIPAKRTSQAAEPKVQLKTSNSDLKDKLKRTPKASDDLKAQETGSIDDFVIFDVTSKPDRHQEQVSKSEENILKNLSQTPESDIEKSLAKLSSRIDADLEEIETEEMKKQARKSKIPIDRRRVSSSIDGTDKESAPTVHTQEAHQPYHVNLASTPTDESKNAELKAEEIKFEVGTPVRPLRTSPASSSTALAPLAIIDIALNDPSLPESVDESFHSPKSEKSLPSSSTRRKIAFVPQLSIYTPEEQELLKSNFQANALDSLDMNSLPPDSSVFPVFDESLVRNVQPFCPQSSSCFSR